MPFPTYQRAPKRPPGVAPVVRAEDLTCERLQRRYHVMFTQHFHILPRDWDDLFLDEVMDYVSVCERILEAAKRDAAAILN